MVASPGSLSHLFSSLSLTDPCWRTFPGGPEMEHDDGEHQAPVPGTGPGAVWVLAGEEIHVLDCGT